MTQSNNNVIYTNHKYYLTLAYIKGETAYDMVEYFSTKEGVVSAIKECTQRTYAFLERHFKPVWNELEYLFGMNEEYRDKMTQLLLAQMKYMIRSAGDLKGDTSGEKMRFGETTIDAMLRSAVTHSQEFYDIVSSLPNQMAWRVSDDEWRVGY